MGLSANPTAYKDRIIADGAQNYWRLGDTSGATVADLIGGKTGTLLDTTGQPAFETADYLFGQPGALRGESDTALLLPQASTRVPGYIDVGTDLSLAFTSAFSVELWINTQNRTNSIYSAGLVTRTVLGTVKGWMLLLNPDGTLIFTAASAAPQTLFYATTTQRVADGAWHHVVATFDAVPGPTSAKVYIDGVLCGSTGTSGGTIAADPTGRLLIARSNNSGAQARGLFDEVALYPRVLTANEIAAHYTLARTAPTKALMPAVSNLARSDATRSAYLAAYQPIVAIWGPDGVRYDATPYVKEGSVHISQHLNAAIDTASLTLLPDFTHYYGTTVPAMRTRIEIAMGNQTNVEFSGQIISMQESRVPMQRGGVRDQRPFIDLTCIDWLDVFDAALVTEGWPTQSATATIIDLVTRHVRGGNPTSRPFPFTTGFVQTNLPVLASREVVNERPSTIMQRLTNLCGGGFYIDPERGVHAWGTTPEPLSRPQPLTETLPTVKSFRRQTDGAQQRTRIFVEGQRTTALHALPNVALPGGTIPSSGYFSVALAEGAFLPRGAPLPLGAGHQVGTTNPEWLVRIGSNLVTFRETYVFPLPASGNYPSVTLTSAANPADAYLYVTTLPPEWPRYVEGSTTQMWHGYVKVGDQYVNVFVLSPTQLWVDPFTTQYGVGRLQTAVPIGTVVTPVPAAIFQCKALVKFALGYQPGDFNGPGSAPWAGLGRYYGPVKAQPAGTPVVLLEPSQASFSTPSFSETEFSDGWHEHIVQDGRFSYSTAQQRGAAEITAFAAPLVAYEWDTEDFNAKPGRVQQIALTQGNTVAEMGTVINDVEIVWPVSKRPPLRSCRALKTAQAIPVLEAWLNDPT